MRFTRRRLSIRNQDPVEDRLLAMVAALTAEVAIVRERLDTVERLTEAAGVLTRDAIETFAPNPAQSVEREGIRKRIIAKIFRPLRDDAAREAAEHRNAN